MRKSRFMARDCKCGAQASLSSMGRCQEANRMELQEQSVTGLDPSGTSWQYSISTSRMAVHFVC
jgi:hypothetical protein